jgi:hypothetical protein
MKKVFTSPDNTELELLQNMLTEAEIPCEARNVNAHILLPGVPFYPELWILNDADYTKAADLIDGFEHPSIVGAGIWQCPKCTEQLGSQFESCWQCGAKRTDAA